MRFRKSLLLFVSALVIAAISSPVNAWAQAKKIKVGYSSDAPGSLATWLARDTGIFAKNGLDVELVRTRTTVGVMALLSGELDFIQASGPVVIESNLRGTDLVYVAGGMATLDFIFMSQPEIKSAEMLKGGVVGLASIRGASLVATEFALEKLGLKSRDVKFIVIGGTPERLISLRSKLLQATLLSPHERRRGARGFQFFGGCRSLGTAVSSQRHCAVAPVYPRQFGHGETLRQVADRRRSSDEDRSKN